MKKISLLISILSLVVAGVSAYYAYSAQTESRSLFLIEKRPYIDAEVVTLNGQYLNIESREGEPTAGVSLKISNVGGIAARDLSIDLLYMDDNGNVFQTVNLNIPDQEKLLPGSKEFLNPTITNKSPQFNDALKSGKLNFQLVINYKSDVDENIQYDTRAQFSVTKNNITLLGGLPEFQ